MLHHFSILSDYFYSVTWCCRTVYIFNDWWMFVSSGNVKSSERPRPFTLHLIAKFTDLFWRYGAQITCLPVPDCKNTSPSLWWCTSHQDAHIILWSPLLTRIASRPCNAAGVQRCIVMPGCPTAPIPFKALPSGWHQLGCCSKRCPFFSVIKCGLCIEVSKAPEA